MKKVVLPILILVAGFGIAALIVATGPTLEQQAPPPSSPLVRVWTAQAQVIQMKTIAHGTVLPRTESDLIPEVSGRIINIAKSMVSGGFFNKGDLLIEIESLDYQESVQQAQATLESSQSELASAQRAHVRQQDLARKQSTSETLRDEALNRYRTAQARLKEAKSRLSRAQRDLERTKITAPYDGRVRSESVDIGQFVTRGAAVANLYATDYAEVRLPVHDEELAYLNVPLGDSPMPESEYPTTLLRAQFAGKEHTWVGKIVRTEGELDPQTRMINVVAQVAEPYKNSDGQPPLAVGLFVEAEISGTTVENVFVLPRSAIQANNQVYVVKADNSISFRDINILRIVEEDVYVAAGIAAGETISLSTISNAVEGMSVRPVANPQAQATDIAPTQTVQIVAGTAR